MTEHGTEVYDNLFITRTWEIGIARDRVALTPEIMEEALQAVQAIGGKLVRVILPDEQDEVSETDFRIVTETGIEFREGNVDLEICTENVSVRIPAASLDNAENVHFRLTPVRDEAKRKEIEERANVSQAVISVSQGQNAQVLGRPVMIETNLQNHPVTLVLPLRDADLPADPNERDEFLADLKVYIEHSDGSIEAVTPQAVEYKPGMPGLQFTVSKFSTFAILNIEGEREQGHRHQAYMSGYPGGTFRPDRAVTRAEMAAILARLLGFGGTGGAASSFADVGAGHWAAEEIEFVKRTGLMVGDESGRFRPDAPITRGEMAAMAARFKRLETSGYAKPSFADVKESYWGFASIEAAREAGILSGYPDGTFRPHGHLTRAEAVTVINRLFERGPLYGITQPSWPDVPQSHWAFAEIEEASRDHQYTVLPDGREYVSE